MVKKKKRRKKGTESERVGGRQLTQRAYNLDGDYGSD